MKKLFDIEENDYGYNACVGNNGSPDMDHYFHGYKVAAKHLLKHIVEKKDYELPNDTIIYPVSFLIRHYCELYLKNYIKILEFISRKLNFKNFKDISQTHSLSILWEYFKELANNDQRLQTYTYRLNSFIIDISEIDDTGQTFRYPFSAENRKHLTSVGHISLRILRNGFITVIEIMDELEYLLEFLYGEYNSGTVICGLNREQIYQIAKKLPDRSLWNNVSFDQMKKSIKDEYNLSSNKLSKVIKKIESHYYFASLIGVEKSLIYINKEKIIFIIENLKSKKVDELLAIITKANLENELFDYYTLFELSNSYCIYSNFYSENYELVFDSIRKEFNIKDILYELIHYKNEYIIKKVLRSLHFLGQKKIIEIINKYLPVEYFDN